MTDVWGYRHAGSSVSTLFRDRAWERGGPARSTAASPRTSSTNSRDSPPQQVIDVLGRAFQQVANAGARVDGEGDLEAVAAATLLESTIVLTCSNEG